MLRVPVPVATATLLMGAAILPPIILDTFERGELSKVGLGFVSISLIFMLYGLATLIPAIRNCKRSSIPAGARLTLVVNILFLAFFSLEFCDLMVRQNGKLLYWTNLLFLPAILLFWGLVTTQRWAWQISRGVAALGVLWFLGFALLIPFGNIQRNGIPAPWDVRVYMICASLGFASALAGAFWSIGHPETRRFFGLTPRQDSQAT